MIMFNSNIKRSNTECLKTNVFFFFGFVEYVCSNHVQVVVQLVVGSVEIKSWIKRKQRNNLMENSNRTIRKWYVYKTLV